ncbi:MAG: FAD-dependent oxidoreductase [Candidatus Pacebacteria bacterium]|nr:FAD-dependent oxidoreductase [Candidatus Paceibacterota bacterium]
MYDLVIIGGGPAGCAAGVYAARKLLRTTLITETFGGQSEVSADIENWIGTPHISGTQLAKDLETHVRTYAGSVVDIKTGVRAVSVIAHGGHYAVHLDDQSIVEAKTILVASGGSRRKLTVPGAELFDQKGLTYCASCDGPLFSGQDVAVVGGGNAGFETAAQLLAYTKSVTLLQTGDMYAADPVTVEKVLAHPNMRGITNAETLEITGTKFVTGLRYKDKKNGMEHTLPVTGVFVEIGLVPSTDYIAPLIDVDQYKRVIVDQRTMRTSMAGIWAAGDCTNGLYHQNNIAAGDAVKALEDIYVYLKAS